MRLFENFSECAIIRRLKKLIEKYFYIYFSRRKNSGDALNAGISCAGILSVVFFVILRAVFSLRCLIRNVPKPRKKTFSLRICAARTSSMKPSTTADTVVASTPVSLAICLTISCFVVDAYFLMFLICESVAKVHPFVKYTHDLYPFIARNAIKDDVFVDLESENICSEFLVFPTEQHGIACQLTAGGDQ